jgi:Na+-transporting NADH:ubiquinone oxidoreductase subunit NqrA
MGRFPHRSAQPRTSALGLMGQIYNRATHLATRLAELQTTVVVCHRQAGPARQTAVTRVTQASIIGPHPPGPSST